MKTKQKATTKSHFVFIVVSVARSLFHSIRDPIIEPLVQPFLVSGPTRVTQTNRKNIYVIKNIIKYRKRQLEYLCDKDLKFLSLVILLVNYYLIWI